MQLNVFFCIVVVVSQQNYTPFGASKTRGSKN